MSQSSEPRSNKATAALAFAALGVVYGDIGTSPLYAIKEGFSGTGPFAMELTRDNVLGVLSLIFWSLNFVVSFKYIWQVMRADNRGEGGILALLALARPNGQPQGRGIMILLGLFGAALLYGDGIITPAISVLGAIEGLEYKTEFFRPWVIPIAIGIISALFYLQRRGTAGIGKIFGPITTVWFITIGLLGIRGILMYPGVLAAINPWYAVQFFLQQGSQGILILAVVVLVITGGEALYADMGHFGAQPIRWAWFGVVLPALVLNYFGQGAWLISTPDALAGANFNPFYALAPEWAMYPVIVIATGAAVVASQALISGAYSLTQQAMQLGFAPRMRLIHTSSTEKGQIYMPGLNAALWAACIALVLAFRSSEALAQTYGVAVTQTMLITSLLFAIVARKRWNWPLWRVVVLTTLFVMVDLAFVSANLLKVPHGGWFPLLVAALVFLLMTTWKKGRAQITGILRESSLPLDQFIEELDRVQPHRVPGVAVFMTSIPDVAPSVLLHHLKHNKVLHQKVILVTMESEEVPVVPEEERAVVIPKGQGIFEVIARHGFMETPAVPAVLELVADQLRDEGEEKVPSMRPAGISFFLGRETLIVHAKRRGRGRMSALRAKLFSVMSRNAQSAAAYFGLPPNRVVELGSQIKI